MLNASDFCILLSAAAPIVGPVRQQLFARVGTSSCAFGRRNRDLYVTSCRVFTPASFDEGPCDAAAARNELVARALVTQGGALASTLA